MKNGSGQDASVRVLLVDDVPGYPIERQREECAAYAHGLEFELFDEWVGPARSTDVLIVAALRLLAEKSGWKSPGGKVKALRTRAAKAIRTATVIEGATGVSSAQRVLWANALRRATAAVNSGGHMHGEAARQRGRKGGLRGGKVLKARSAVQRWKKEPALLQRCKAVWRSREYLGDEARLAAINAMLAAEDRAGMQIGSTATARRVFSNVIKRS